ncbi:hypothetical protein D4758_07670 [Enterocloster citroniae]|nr:hypothetical protein [Enterocloster citroniae]
MSIKDNRANICARLISRNIEFTLALRCELEFTISFKYPEYLEELFEKIEIHKKHMFCQNNYITHPYLCQWTREGK